MLSLDSLSEKEMDEALAWAKRMLKASEVFPRLGFAIRGSAEKSARAWGNVVTLLSRETSRRDLFNKSITDLVDMIGDLYDFPGVCLVYDRKEEVWKISGSRTLVLRCAGPPLRDLLIQLVRERL